MLDLLIKGGWILDGTGSHARRLDLGIVAGRIVFLAPPPAPAAAQVIDVQGRFVTPGFFDLHAHSDLRLLQDPRAESKVFQGVTTETVGLCGYSCAPLHGPSGTELAGEIEDEYGFRPAWDSFGSYLAALEERGTAVNVAGFVGQGTIRQMAAGFKAGPVNRDGMRLMQRLLTESLAEGAFGLSTGLIYPPGCYADTGELVELAACLAARGGIYTTHLRDEGDDLLPAVAEALTIGERAGVPVHLCHHKAAGRRNWGKTGASLAMVDAARRGGQDVTLDVYPYLATSTVLSAVLPPWVQEGGPLCALERLTGGEIRDRIKAELEGRASQEPGIWEDIVISHVRNPALAHLQGRSLARIALDSRVRPVEMLMDLLVEEQLKVSMIRFAMGDDDLDRVIRHPQSMIGSDAGARSFRNHLTEGRPHPRCFGTFPRILGHYVRERGVLSLAEAVRKMTSLPASRLGIRDRGVIDKGFWADLVVFDPLRIRDRATYEDPFQPPEGISLVIVNGRVVVRDGRHSGLLAGMVLKSGG
ncbi:MAG: D-aminoacylase [Firmicutes bacterium]|nr:D-aminoacylase [Bacillota bacterium]